MRCSAQILSLLLVIILATSVLVGCNTSARQTSHPSLPKDPGSVTIVAGQATTLDLGNRGDLIIPPGAMTPGATVRATYQGRPGGSWVNIAPTSDPIELISNPPNAIHGLLTLEFPVPANKIAPGVDPTTQFGISTYISSARPRDYRGIASRLTIKAGLQAASKEQTPLAHSKPARKGRGEKWRENVAYAD